MVMPLFGQPAGNFYHGDDFGIIVSHDFIQVGQMIRVTMGNQDMICRYILHDNMLCFWIRCNEGIGQYADIGFE